MIIKNLQEIEQTERYVHWGNGTSHRLLTAQDGMGFTMCYTVVYPGTESFLEYKHHLEACYCVEGEGEVEDEHGTIYPIKPGIMYALDQHDTHKLRATGDQNLILLSVFNPPLTGTENHSLSPDGASGYEIV
ncbi:MAG: ectoine synthase, partial [Chloroflexota bacterium]